MNTLRRPISNRTKAYLAVPIFIIGLGVNPITPAQADELHEPEFYQTSEVTNASIYPSAQALETSDQTAESDTFNVVNQSLAVEIEEKKPEPTPKAEETEEGIPETSTDDFNFPDSRFDVAKTIALAYEEVGSSRPTGWSAEGECIMSAKRWIEAGGGNWTGEGTPLSNYSNADKIEYENVRPGDVVQYIHTDSPDSWVSGIHTVLITGVNEDGSFRIVESNNPGGSGLVSKNDKWLPSPPPGFETHFYRF